MRLTKVIRLQANKDANAELHAHMVAYPPDKQDKATQTVLQQAELLCADWAG
jgi:type I restriction enzyme R subunit